MNINIKVGDYVTIESVPPENDGVYSMVVMIGKEYKVQQLRDGLLKINGFYFRWENIASLKDLFAQIKTLEKEAFDKLEDANRLWRKLK